ncbi:MAG: excinuclease ABC subunit UvrA [Spirochaetia bacterium]|jgi:excinuclease ABC subunit A|uniref:UvrABC system protein A n=1 Tax=uncultured Spirochaetota bacterium TaxID=460511 RepID=A0A652ZY06_9SPIR|nr:excinuclease ABC subunit UvrA [Spirochaetia bacterium]MCE1209623.1 excinuclease ABC subunit UvrA [Spirochaetia bacterium]VBB40676.1 ATPase and DNA damage recognition protein of nucleotide excision repair excinuclease UvrABC [uncultured Spirochaetota bacterium]
MEKLIIKGAREHNLKNVDLELPRDKLIVISGLSGSGKSSLAFDTIFAEGQRRYVESLSAYARQFLGRMDKPDVDYIEGLSPAISIEQKTTHRNPRSTVGTVTEIYDYFRLLFARIGIPHCPSCGRVIKEQSVDQILEAILSWPSGSKLQILAPVVRAMKGEHKKWMEDARKQGFARARVDGEMRSLEEPIQLEKQKKHSIEIVVDRIKLGPDSRRRIAEAVETSLHIADGSVIVIRENEKESAEEYFSQKGACPDCGISLPEMEPRLFSFNAPQGACPACTGLGITQEFDPDLIIPDKSLSFDEGGCIPYNPSSAWNRSRFEALAGHYKFKLDTPFEALKPEIMRAILYGSPDPIKIVYENREKTGHFEYQSRFPGILIDLKRRYNETTSPGIKEWLESFMTERHCEACKGKRLRPEALAVTVGGRSIHDISQLSVEESLKFFSSLALTDVEKQISKQIVKEIKARLSFMKNVGLDYLSLERKAATLSGGEAQRIRLATQIGSSLVGVLYILDEPSIGLHQRDNQRLIETLIYLRDLGNTLIVVEHDEQTLRTADYIVDLGPGAGEHGGKIVAQGSPEEVMKSPKSLTGQYLAGKLRIEVPAVRRQGNGKAILLRGAREHNLKGVDLRLPLGLFICVTGVSGSGKSTMLTDLLYPAISNRIMRSSLAEGDFDSIEGLEHIDKIINIDQSPIGRTPRSNPATYVGLFTGIRELFASLPESKARGWKAGRFSFNVKGGRCENCQGDGTIKIEMNFLPDVYITCDVCHGKRFNADTLDIRYKGKNIADVLDMTIEEAASFFAHIPHIAHKLETLLSVGLGYVKVGQSALTLSGGEAQRVKLAFELSRRATGKTLYFMDEPTTGLHFADVKQLMEVIQRLVDTGNTVVMIEHNLDVIKQADWIVDMGPEGGTRGGMIVAEGRPEDVVKVRASHTGRYLKDYLRSHV